MAFPEFRLVLAMGTAPRVPARAVTEPALGVAAARPGPGGPAKVIAYPRHEATMALNLFEETMALLAELERHGVPYAVAGALALAIHGVPRATTDIDLLVRREDVDAALRVASASGFGVQALPMRFSDGLEVRRSTKVETAEMLTLDLLLVNDNLEPVWASRERVPTEGGEVWVVSRRGLIDMKAWAGREQDLADIRRLRELDR